METFVKELIANTVDLSTLTQKIVREKYKAHAAKESISHEEKLQLKKVVFQAVSEFQEKLLQTNADKTTSSIDDKENVKQNENSTSVQKESPRKKGKRTHSDVLSEDDQNANSPGHQRTKKFKPEGSEVNNCKSADEKQSPKKALLQESKDSNRSSPQKNCEKPKARKRLSSGDVRDAIFEENEENLAPSSSSENDDESDEDEKEEKTRSSKKQISSDNDSGSVSEEYGSPFKDESGLKEKEKIASDLESFIVDSESDFTPVKKTKKSGVRKFSKKGTNKENNETQSDEDIENEVESPIEKAKKWKQKLKKMVLLDSESDGSPIKINKNSRNIVEKGVSKKKLKKKALSGSDCDDESSATDSEEESLAMKKSKLVTKKSEKPKISMDSDNSDSKDESLTKKKSKDESLTKMKSKDESLTKKKSKLSKHNSSSDDGSEDSSSDDDSEDESLAKKKNKVSDKKLLQSSDSESSDDESLAKKKQNVENKKLLQSSDSESSDDESLAKKKQNVENKKSAEISDSESSDDESLAKKKSKLPNKDNDTSDTSVHDSEPEKPKKKKRKSQSKSSEEDNKKGKSDGKKAGDPTKTSNVLRLEKIARYCGIMPCGKRYTEFFKDCTTARKREKKLKQLLIDAGMEGNPSMKKAAELKIKKEVMELGSSQIIADSGRGKRRNVFSLYAKAEIKEDRAPKTPPKTPPAKHDFKNLKGIIDSDSSESD